MNSPAGRVSLRHDARGFRLCVAGEFSELIRTEGITDAIGFDLAMVRARPVPGGRGLNWIIERADHKDRIRVRPDRHGGALASWLSDRSWTPRRVFREFSNTTTLRERGVLLPVPVFALSQRRGLFWRSAFASVEREQARDGIDWLAEDPTKALLDRMAVVLAKAIRAFHDAGAIHGDLHIRNVLIESEFDGREDREHASLRCMLIDLDRTRIVESVSPRQRLRELLRFNRSLEKTGHIELTSRRYRAIALSAYCGGDRRLRRSMMRWSRLEALGIGRHRIAWRMGL